MWACGRRVGADLMGYQFDGTLDIDIVGHDIMVSCMICNLG